MVGEELRERVLRRLEELRIGPVEAAKRVNGLERNYIRDLIEGKKRSFGSAKLSDVARALQWTIADLRGETPVDRDNVVSIPIVAFAGMVELADPENCLDPKSFPQRQFTDLPPGDWFATHVADDAMSRVSPRGAMIVVNRADKSLVNGKSYLVVIDQQVLYRAYQESPIAHLKPNSSSSDYELIYLQRKKNIRVIGRVARTLMDL